MSSKHVVLGVTGSVAAYKAADILRRLSEKGFKVSVIMTKGAEHFITPLTLSSLSEGKVYSGLFDKDEKPNSMPHIDLARSADVVLIAPATANIIGKMANGLADDLLSCVVLATRAKVMVAPAMNTQMYHNSIVVQNCDKLKEHDVSFIDPTDGLLACGEVGEGHLAEVDDIVAAVAKQLQE
ncbi:MAG: phosphopantothenoylcysteine decarboxylase/phosphopantothenate--cysteine ligase [Lysobacterales bacterium]|jgi:phosphopantothenoylcysteine decarboxylase/phosphopantothenate--cysteine ligase